MAPARAPVVAPVMTVVAAPVAIVGFPTLTKAEFDLMLRNHLQTPGITPGREKKKEKKKKVEVDNSSSEEEGVEIPNNEYGWLATIRMLAILQVQQLVAVGN